MFAAIGDRLVIHSGRVDGPERDAEVLEVRHADGSPPYVVRWSDTGRESLVFPGPDATVQHFAGPTGEGQGSARDGTSVPISHPSTSGTVEPGGVGHVAHR